MRGTHLKSSSSAMGLKSTRLSLEFNSFARNFTVYFHFLPHDSQKIKNAETSNNIPVTIMTI
jgi:hypothetical protein